MTERPTGNLTTFWDHEPAGDVPAIMADAQRHARECGRTVAVVGPTKIWHVHPDGRIEDVTPQGELMEIEDTRPPVLCRECRDGKHPNCTGDALDPVTDQIVDCQCPRCI